ncbi:unnamed protein product [Blepharisma stoltei]|uniref:Uncharacterized protein n=1 Tax=Blepharisma stoltei TaxID=1481888 RepID=A0AAU9K5G5_9CILI|nr:unnamed protein product [Blepharisma stoltei]
MNPISGKPLHNNNSFGVKNKQEFNIIQWDTPDLHKNSKKFPSDLKTNRIDYATEERLRREEENKRKALIYNQKREAAMKRDLLISQKNTIVEIKEAEKLEQKRSKFSDYKSHAGLAYNSISLEYHNSQRGKELQRQDEYQQHKMGQRFQSLDSKRNSGFNIITGEPRYNLISQIQPSRHS